MTSLILMTKKSHFTTPTGINSPATFFTKRSNQFIGMAQFKLLPKRKQNLHPNTNHKTSTLHSRTVQNPTLPNYLTVITTPQYDIYAATNWQDLASSNNSQ